MKKKVILILLIVFAFAACFIPVPQQKTIPINAAFLNVFIQMSKPENWRKWRSDMNNLPASDSDKIVVKKDTASFGISYKLKKINVESKGNVFVIKDNWSNKAIHYSYAII